MELLRSLYAFWVAKHSLYNALKSGNLTKKRGNALWKNVLEKWRTKKRMVSILQTCDRRRSRILEERHSCIGDSNSVVE